MATFIVLVFIVGLSVLIVLETMRRWSADHYKSRRSDCGNIIRIGVPRSKIAPGLLYEQIIKYHQISLNTKK